MDPVPKDGGQLQEAYRYATTLYISMFSLRYRTPLGDKVIWPSQYTWLLQERLTYWKHHPNWGLLVEDIQNKSKIDNFSRLIALCQVLWFLVNASCVLLVLFHSQIESMKFGYIPLFAVTYFFWWDKPKDIRSPSIIEL